MSQPLQMQKQTHTESANSRNSEALAHKVKDSLAGPNCQPVPWKPTAGIEANPRKSGP